MRVSRILLATVLVPLWARAAEVPKADVSAYALTLGEAGKPGELVTTSPDGKSALIFERAGAQQRIWISSEGKKTVIQSGSFDGHRELSAAAWSPDGTKVAVVQHVKQDRSTLVVHTIGNGSKVEVAIEHPVFDGASWLRWVKDDEIFFVKDAFFGRLDLNTLRVSAAAEQDVFPPPAHSVVFYLREQGHAPVPGTYVGAKGKYLITLLTPEPFTGVDPDLKSITVGRFNSVRQVALTVGPEKNWPEKVIGRPEGMVSIPAEKFAVIARSYRAAFSPTATSDSGVKVIVYRPRLNPLNNRPVGPDLNQPVAYGLVNEVSTDGVEILVGASVGPIQAGDVITRFSIFSMGWRVGDDEGLVVKELAPSDAWLAEVKAAKEKESTEAQAKKDKLEAERLAAKEKADADRAARKLAAEQAAAKRKADAAAKRAEQDAARKARIEAK